MRKLPEEGHVPIPTRWIDTGRNGYMKRDNGPTVEVYLKSGFVGRVDLGGLDDLKKGFLDGRHRKP